MKVLKVTKNKVVLEPIRQMKLHLECGHITTLHGPVSMKPPTYIRWRCRKCDNDVPVPKSHVRGV